MASAASCAPEALGSRAAHVLDEVVQILRQLGAVAMEEEINASDANESMGETGSDTLHVIVMSFLLLLVLVVGYRWGVWAATQRAELQAQLRAEQQAQQQAQLQEELIASQDREEKWSEKYQYAKLKLHQFPAGQLREACDAVGFHCGAGATKEAMIRGLLVEHGFELQSMVPEVGGVLGALVKASSSEADSHMRRHVMRSGAPASEHGRSVREDVEGAHRRIG